MSLPVDFFFATLSANYKEEEKKKEGKIKIDDFLFFSLTISDLS